MYLIPVETPQDFLLAQQFIIPHEQTCIFLSSYLRRGSKHLFLLSNNETPEKIEQLQGVIYIDGTLFHCIPYPSRLDATEFAAKLLSLCGLQNNSKNTIFQDNTKIKCISGETQTTDFLINLLSDHLGAPYQTNHYKLMTAKQIVNPPEKLCNDDQIICCTENELEDLLAIQKKYVTEEVAPFGKEVSDTEISMGLRQILKNQICLALSTDGELVAKANTNAIGMNWVQLGGIYTHPLYRRNGYAWQLISAICRRTVKAGKNAALFVKDINVPAMELYKKLGFSNSGHYTIAYY